VLFVVIEEVGGCVWNVKMTLFASISGTLFLVLAACCLLPIDCVFYGPPFSQSCVLPCGCHSIECNRSLELISFGETMTDGRLDISHTDRCLDPAEHTYMENGAKASIVLVKGGLSKTC
jgi:hypothetical protein